MKKRFRFLYFLASALIKKQWKFIFPSLLTLLILFILLLTFSPLLQRNLINVRGSLFKQTFIEAVVGEPKTFNPLFSRLETENEINRLVFRGLTKISTSGAIVGDLAEKIELKGDSEYIFYLKKDVVWHDGEKFKADDVIHTIRLSQNALYDSVVASNFKDVTVKKIDDFTVSFQLKEPFSPFLSATTVGIIPEHVSLNDYRPIGTGKFRFIEIKKDSVTVESSHLKVKFKYYPSQAVAETALKLGEVHAVTNHDLNNSELSKWRNFNIYQANLGLRPLTLFFNTKDEYLKEKSLRQALIYSINKPNLILSKNGTKGKIAVNSFADLNPLGLNKTERFSYNVERTNQLLKHLGWELQDNFLYKNGKKLSFTLTTLADNDILDTAKKIQASWRALGVDVEINIISGSELKEQVAANKTFTVLLSPQLLNIDPDQYVLWHTTQVNSSNISGISSPKLDKLLEDGRRSVDPNVRKEKYQEFDRLLADEAPAVFLYYPRFVWLVSDRVKNIKLEGFIEPSDRFLSSDNWEIQNPVF